MLGYFHLIELFILRLQAYPTYLMCCFVHNKSTSTKRFSLYKYFHYIVLFHFIVLFWLKKMLICKICIFQVLLRMVATSQSTSTVHTWVEWLPWQPSPTLHISQCQESIAARGRLHRTNCLLKCLMFAGRGGGYVLALTTPTIYRKVVCLRVIWTGLGAQYWKWY